MDGMLLNLHTFNLLISMQAPELLMSEEEDANGDNPIVSRSTEADIYALGMVCWHSKRGPISHMAVLDNACMFVHNLRRLNRCLTHCRKP